MRIGLIDVDGHNFPNLALMKLSAWHKSQGDMVEFANPMFGEYDRVYMSKVFTFTPDCVDIYDCEVIKAGTGYKDYFHILPDDIEHICPDYSLYGVKEAYGFLTRGCVNRCPWCIVPKKEGFIQPASDIEEFLDGRKEAILLDNNVLASDWGVMQVEKIAELKVRVDFNQGLEARQIASNPELAKLLAKVKWIRYIRMAYDSKSAEPYVRGAIELLCKYGVSPRNIFIYVLIRDDIQDAYDRIMDMRRLGCIPFAQPYRDFDNKNEPSREQRRLARWCNHKAIFNSVDFKDYK